MYRYVLEDYVEKLSILMISLLKRDRVLIYPIQVKSYLKKRRSVGSHPNRRLLNRALILMRPKMLLFRSIV